MEENKDLNVAMPTAVEPNAVPPMNTPVEPTPTPVTPVPVAAPVEVPVTTPSTVEVATVTTPTPVAEQPVIQVPTETTPSVVPTEVAEVQAAPSEPEPEQEGNGDTITFDYNQLYQSNQAAPQTVEQTVQAVPTIQETPIVLETDKPEVQAAPVVKDIIPTFDTNALEDDLPDELKPKVEEPLIHTVATETQKEKQESHQNILFIIIFFAVLIIAVLIIFPMMLGI